MNYTQSKKVNKRLLLKLLRRRISMHGMNHGFGNDNMQMFILMMLLFPGMLGGNNMLPLLLLLMSN